MNIEEIKDELSHILTCALNRDYCWGCFFHYICLLRGSVCKAYYKICNELDDIVENDNDD